MSSTVSQLSARMRLFELIRQEQMALSPPKANKAAALKEAEQVQAFQQLALKSFR